MLWKEVNCEDVQCEAGDTPAIPIVRVLEPGDLAVGTSMIVIPTLGVPIPILPGSGPRSGCVTRRLHDDEAFRFSPLLQETEFSTWGSDFDAGTSTPRAWAGRLLLNYYVTSLVRPIPQGVPLIPRVVLFVPGPSSALGILSRPSLKPASFGTPVNARSKALLYPASSSARRIVSLAEILSFVGHGCRLMVCEGAVASYARLRSTVERSLWLRGSCAQLWILSKLAKWEQFGVRTWNLAGRSVWSTVLRRLGWSEMRRAFG
ncbi:hypothetical protein VTK73DRAFT_10372 [Phialemonium thermophilum]|uniref:Uncharacterized protein n=1 Tax=Phialemonium thermophilum TaxID=223376 RepID=A0ABR3VX34_9PEZI